jgi:aspartyl-tRNA synthetase
MERTHTCNDLKLKDNGKEVILVGWARRLRDHGGKKFIDLADKEGITQVVFDPDHTQNFEKVNDIKREYLIQIFGKVRPRLEGTVNDKLSTGEIEVLVSKFNVVSECDVLPFEIDDETFKNVNEEIRLEYRYLDLRRPSMIKVLKDRHKFIKTVRDILDEKGFLEIETPNLTKSTPEGSRDFLIPYRKKKGEFFALPQSPQMFKQMLMVAGVEKYFQIATCFRDEDLRKDRQYEHKQLDMEVAFMTRDELFNLTEEIFSKTFKKVFNQELKTPFIRLPYKEAMDKYGSDKPDLRIVGLELKDISEIVKNSGFGVFSSVVKSGGIVKGFNLKNGQELMSRKDIDKLISYSQEMGAKGLAWMKVIEGEKIESSIAKFFKEDELEEIKNKLEGEKGDLLFFVADKKDTTNKVLDALRRKLASDYNLIDETKESFCFIVDFPLFQWDEENDTLTFEHSPFTMPNKEDVEFLMSLTYDKIKENKDKLLSLKSEAYDLVYKGVELGSGALRIHDPKLQRKIFELLGKTPEQIEENFGWFVKAYNYAAPPHRGWGLGIDRILMLAEEKESIRDVIPFPRNKHGFCPLTKSPSTIDEKQLRELGLQIIPDKK